MSDSIKPFPWPDGCRAAVSLSFDDARASQVTAGLPILDAAGVRATFYVMMRNVEPHRDAWLKAHADGHEIGNHSVNHPCSSNFPFAKLKGLEDYTLDRMAVELDEASAAIADCFGATPTSFAYPCGMTWLGRGKAHQSYVPLVAERFVAGRGCFSEWHNDPWRCDPALLFSMDMDGGTEGRLNALIDRAIEEGGWLSLTGHDVADKRQQAISPRSLERVCERCVESKDIWIDTITTVTRHVINHRPGSSD